MDTDTHSTKFSVNYDTLHSVHLQEEHEAGTY
jgi:hypothetical protein